MKFDKCVPFYFEVKEHNRVESPRMESPKALAQKKDRPCKTWRRTIEKEVKKRDPKRGKEDE